MSRDVEGCMILLVGVILGILIKVGIDMVV